MRIGRRLALTLMLAAVSGMIAPRRRRATFRRGILAATLGPALLLCGLDLIRARVLGIPERAERGKEEQPSSLAGHLVQAAGGEPGERPL